MGKVKSVLKKVTGTLKIATAFLPIVAALGGFVTEAGLALGTAFYYKGVKNSFRENDYFIERRIEDLDEAVKQYENGELDKTEYSQKIDYLASDDYLVDIMENGGEETAEFQGKLKNVKDCVIGLISVGSLTVAGLITCGVAYFTHDFIDDLYESGKADFRYKASDDPPKKKKYVPDAQRGAPLQEETKKDDDDGFESDEGVYENIDDYYDRFQNN